MITKMASLEEVKKLREKTGVGFTDCKEALEESKGDIEKAIEILRKKGIAKAAKRSERSSSEGTIGSYVHQNHIGVLVELNAETDFVARNEKFQELARDIAMHIAAAAPLYVAPEDVPENVLEKEKEIYAEELNLKGKPKEVIEKILDGKLQKYYEEVCLLEQEFVKDTSKKIKDLINEAIAAMGEKIQIGKFSRIVVGA